MAYTTMTPKYLDLQFWKQLYAGSLPLDHQERKEPVYLMPGEEDGEKYIYILLTKHSDWVSLLVYLLAGRGYTHTSIALGDDPASYYSFNFKGFVEESLEKHHRKGAQFCCYRLAVSQEAYEKIQHRLLFFRQHRKRFEYSRLGLLCCVLACPCAGNGSISAPSSWRSCWKSPRPCLCPDDPPSSSPTTLSPSWSATPPA